MKNQFIFRIRFSFIKVEMGKCWDSHTFVFAAFSFLPLLLVPQRPLRKNSNSISMISCENEKFFKNFCYTQTNFLSSLDFHNISYTHKHSLKYISFNYFKEFFQHYYTFGFSDEMKNSYQKTSKRKVTTHLGKHEKNFRNFQSNKH